MTYPISTEPEGPITDDNGDELEHGEPDPTPEDPKPVMQMGGGWNPTTPEDPLRAAAQEWADLCHDYDLNGHGQAVMTRLRDALADPPVEVGEEDERETFVYQEGWAAGHRAALLEPTDKSQISSYEAALRSAAPALDVERLAEHLHDAFHGETEHQYATCVHKDHWRAKAGALGRRVTVYEQSGNER